MALLTAAAVALAIAVAAVVVWFGVRGQLLGQIDDDLTAMSHQVTTPGAPSGHPPDGQDAQGDNGQGDHGPPPRQDIVDRLLASCGTTNATPVPPKFDMQVIKSDGTRCGASPDLVVVTAADTHVTTTPHASMLRDGTTTGGVHVRVLTTWVSDGAALTVAEPLTNVDSSLGSLALLLIFVGALGALGAATLGLLVARAALRPVDRLTGAVEHLARTEDLTVNIPVLGNDEIARLGRSFNTLTTALASSRDRQQQLIADAGHELRTPLTSLRSNIDLLIRSEQTGRELPADRRSTLLSDVKDQLAELSLLVVDLLDLARPDATAASAAEGDLSVVALHDVTARAVARGRLRGPGLRIDATLAPWYTRGDERSLGRAVVNLIDNAVKFSPPGGTVSVRLLGGELTVRDAGPGIAPEDLPHVFERFWRSPAARKLPGSGLGLAIVDRAARDSGGTVTLENAPAGGTLARLHLPGTPTPPEGS
jgi:two-component system sensor histidine kinase MprB